MSPVVQDTSLTSFQVGIGDTHSMSATRVMVSDHHKGQ